MRTGATPALRRDLPWEKRLVRQAVMCPPVRERPEDEGVHPAETDVGSRAPALPGLVGPEWASYPSSWWPLSWSLRPG